MAFKFISDYESKVPNQGWMDNVGWPTTPADETAARNRLQTPHDQTRDYINEYLNYYEDTGSENAYEITIDPSPDTYPRVLLIKAAHGNTGASTIRINNLEPAAIKMGVTEDLAGGEISAGCITCLVYDGQNYQLINALQSDTIMRTNVDQNMTAKLTAASNSYYTTRQVRNIILSDQDADPDLMQNGDIWIKYTDEE